MNKNIEILIPYYNSIDVNEFLSEYGLDYDEYRILPTFGRTLDLKISLEAIDSRKISLTSFLRNVWCSLSTGESITAVYGDIAIVVSKDDIRVEAFVI